MNRLLSSLAAPLFAYSAAMVLANLTVAAFGPVVTPINAFLLIGMDLALRDWLQMRLQKWQMACLIVATSALTWALNPAAQTIAIASAVSFFVAALVDWLTFTLMQGSWLRRSLGSNIAGAAVDSILFPTLAFGVFMPHIVAAQFAAKVAGGGIWAWLLNRFQKPNGLSVRASS
jgi:queuosine precursor transporter